MRISVSTSSLNISISFCRQYNRCKQKTNLSSNEKIINIACEPLRKIITKSDLAFLFAGLRLFFILVFRKRERYS